MAHKIIFLQNVSKNISVTLSWPTWRWIEIVLFKFLNILVDAEALPGSSRKVAKKSRKVREQRRKVGDPPNHLLRDAKLLECQQNGQELPQSIS